MAAQEAARPLRWRYDDVDDSNFAVHGRGIPLLVALLFLILFFVILCLYLRWACSRYNRDTTASAAAVATSSSSSAVRRTAGLDAETISSLPVILYRPASPAGEEMQCSICINSLVEGEKVKALPTCAHCFHPECVDLWLRSQPSCPLCRSSLLAVTKSEVGNEAV